MKFTDLPSDFGYKCRLVALAAMGNRRKVWGIGLDEHAIEWNNCRDIADVLSLWIGNIACEGNYEA